MTSYGKSFIGLLIFRFNVIYEILDINHLSNLLGLFLTNHICYERFWTLEH